MEVLLPWLLYPSREQVQVIAVPWLSRVYVICTLSAVICIPEGEAWGVHKTARRLQITYTLEAMV